MVFSEDGYNKKRDEHGRVLVGNWFEEAVLQTTVGEARSVPQRHIKRAGLLKDFTKRPSEVRVLDDTFERVCGSGTVGGAEGRFLTTSETAYTKPETQPTQKAPRRAKEEAEFQEKAKKALTKTQTKDERRFETEYEAAHAAAAATSTGERVDKADARTAEWLGKHTEFTQPIELQRRGGRFKDESGIRRN
jgi:hypothetical protein